MGPWELYDIEADRTEQTNVVDQEPALAQELIAEWETWAKRSDVDPWVGELREDWGDPVKKEKPKDKTKRKAKGKRNAKGKPVAKQTTKPAEAGG
jgi:arylsulfatase